MHYRHSYHAGNFADVFKHAVLCGLIRALNRKESPWLYVDTHAGAGIYDLRSGAAERTGEWRDGIGRVIPSPRRGEVKGGDELEAPEPLSTCLRIVRELNAGGEVTRYPGSPVFVQALAREQDRMILCENVPEVAAALRRVMGRDPRVALHVRDGYEAYSLLRAARTRGLVLIDPPFERADEFRAVAELLERSVPHFTTFSYAVWYPVKNRHEAARFRRRVARSSGREVLNFLFDCDAPPQGHMRACGMLVINPPYEFDSGMKASLRFLAKKLARGPASRCEVEWVERSLAG